MGVRAPFERAGVAEVLQAAAAEGGRFRFHLRGIQTVVEFSFVNGQIVPNGREMGTTEQRLTLLALADRGEVERLGVFAPREQSKSGMLLTPEWLPIWWEAEHRADGLALTFEKVGLGVCQRLWPDYHQMMAEPDLSDIVVSILRTVDGGKAVAELVVMGPRPPEMVVNVLVQVLQAGLISTQPISMPRMIEPYSLRPVSTSKNDEYTQPVRQPSPLRFKSSRGRSTLSSSPADGAPFAAAFLPSQAGEATPPDGSSSSWGWPQWFLAMAVGALFVGVGLAVLCAQILPTD